jgi:hypothetical protein
VPSKLVSAVALVAAAVLGGVVAIGIGSAFTDEGGTTTVIQEPEAAAAQLELPAAQQDGGMSIEGIYRRAAPGVEIGRAHF